MCKVTIYVCGCCEVFIDRLWSKCHYAPRDIYDCMNLDERTSRAMYCDSCGEGIPYKKPRWYRYLADPHLLITKWREFKAQRAARKKARMERKKVMIEQKRAMIEERGYLAHVKAAEKVHPKILERAGRKSLEDADIAQREFEVYLESLDEDQREAFFKAQREAELKACEKKIIDQRKLQAMLEEFERGW